MPQNFREGATISRTPFCRRPKSERKTDGGRRRGVFDDRDDGQISGVGSHTELLKTNEIYREVSESQPGGGAIDG